MNRCLVLLWISVVAYFIGLSGTDAAMAKSLSTIAVGDKAPAFQLPDQDGTLVSLKDFAGKSPVVLYFYPKDDKLICRKEACLFRDSYKDFEAQGAVVLGVSSDSIKSHKQFVEHQSLPFKLLSDPGGNVRKAYGVPKTALGTLPGRVTFVIDRSGIVRFTFDSLMHADKHVNEALRIVKELKQ